MFCAISGSIPEEPVVSRKSGLLFEKRLIEKALNASGGKCPETGEELNSEDLIEVKASGKSVEPVKASTISFAGVLNHLQSEWDAIILENQQLKKLVSKTRQELAHALYQNDAATRVIHKLEGEKAELEKALDKSFKEPERESSLSSGKRKLDDDKSIANGNSTGDGNSAKMSEDEGNPAPAKRRKESLDEGKKVNGDEGDKHEVDSKVLNSTSLVEDEPKRFSPELVEELKVKMSSLLSARKARKTPATLEDSKAFGSFVSVAQYSNPSNMTGNSIAFIDDSRVAVGWSDGRVSILDSKSLKIMETREQTSKINSLCTTISSNSVFVSGHDDGCVRAWEAKPGGEEIFVSKRGTSIVDVALHPNDRLLFSCAENGTWSWMDLKEAKILAAGGSSMPETELSSGAIHPDGCLFALGSTRGSVEMFDVRVMSKMANFHDERFAGDYGVTCLNMSENGYYLASAVNGTVAIWDLRKQKVAREFKIEETPQPVSVEIDNSGVYGCAVSKNKHVIFSTKKKAGVLAELSYENCDASGAWKRPGVAWDVDAKAVLIGRVNGNVERYSAAK